MIQIRKFGENSDFYLISYVGHDTVDIAPIDGQTGFQGAVPTPGIVNRIPKTRFMIENRDRSRTIFYKICSLVKPRYFNIMFF